MGLLEINKVPKGEYKAVIENLIDTPKYINFGKRIVKILFPPISNLIQILRIFYGQYWLRELEKWDSRKISLGSYCHSQLQLTWSADNGKTWDGFKPTSLNRTETITLYSGEQYKKLITKDDFDTITKLSQKDTTLSLAAITLSSAHQTLSQGNIRFAILEAVTALEIALNEHIRAKTSDSEILSKNISAFHSLPLKTQLITVFSNNNKLSKRELEKAVNVIIIRNRIAHEGYSPNNDEGLYKDIDCLFKAITYLVDGPIFKFPNPNMGNVVFSE